MKQSRSFTEYVKNSLDNQLWKALEEYLEDADASDLDLHLNRINDPGEIELYDTDLQFVDVYDLPESFIAFNAVTDATLIVKDRDHYHTDESESTHQWFMFRCKGNLEKRLSDLEITGIDIYSGRQRSHRPLSDSLVPFIHKSDLEQVADDFLKKYYPEARLQPMWVDPVELAEKLNLTVLCHSISESGSIFGQIYFRETDATLYDDTAKKAVTEHVQPGTVVVDPHVAFQRTLGAYNNTIVHECVHWVLHKKPFALEQLFNEDASLVRCKVTGGIEGKSDDGTRWMEWQANALAPKIQMPLQQFKRKAGEYVRKYRERYGTWELCEIMPYVIDELARFFVVSRMAAKIRMVDAGYEEAAGAFTWIDGAYVKPYAYAKGSLKPNQTYSISVKDAVRIALTNPSFRERAGEGRYIYIDSHFVLNHPKYLIHDENGSPVMTDYARYHMNECGIAFTIGLNGDIDRRYHSECFLNRDQNNPFDFEITFDKGIDEAQGNKMLGETVRKDAAFLRTLPNDFIGAMRMCIDWRGMSQKSLSDASGVSEKTISRIMNGETQGSRVNIVLMCLGLELPPTVSRFILSLTPHNLVYSDEDCIWYGFALDHLYTLGVDRIREILHKQGCENI